MRLAILALTLGGVAISLAGCQSTQESTMGAEYTCQAAGLRPGTNRYARCVAANYQQSRAQSDAAAAAVAAGVVGGAIAGAAVAAPGYGYGGYGYDGYGYDGYGYRPY